MSIRVMCAILVGLLACSSSIAADVVGEGRFTVKSHRTCSTVDSKGVVNDKPIYAIDGAGEFTITKSKGRLLVAEELTYTETTELLDQPVSTLKLKWQLSADGCLELADGVQLGFGYFPISNFPFEPFAVGESRARKMLTFKSFDNNITCAWYPTYSRNNDREVISGPFQTEDRESTLFGTGFMKRTIVGGQLIETVSEWHCTIDVEKLRGMDALMNSIPKKRRQMIMNSKSIMFGSSMEVRPRVVPE